MLFLYAFHILPLHCPSSPAFRLRKKNRAPLPEERGSNCLCARDSARWLSLRFPVPSPNQSGKASADQKHYTGFGYCLQAPFQIDPQSTIRGSRFRTLWIPIVGPEHQRRFRKTVGPNAVIHKINRIKVKRPRTGGRSTRQDIIDLTINKPIRLLS